MWVSIEQIYINLVIIKNKTKNTTSSDYEKIVKLIHSCHYLQNTLKCNMIDLSAEELGTIEYMLRKI